MHAAVGGRRDTGQRVPVELAAAQAEIAAECQAARSLGRPSQVRRSTAKASPGGRLSRTACTAFATSTSAAAGLGQRDALRLTDAADALSEATDFMLAADRHSALAGASAYLKLAAEVAGASLIARGVSAPDLDPRTEEEQRALLGHFAETVLARSPSRLPTIRIGARPM